MSDRSEQVVAAFATIQTVSVLLDMHDWDDILALLNRAEAFGPILDPTDYQQHGRTYSQNARIVRATRDYLTALRREHEEAVSRA